jgi:predicted Zn finger-like uncharacterized protein
MLNTRCPHCGTTFRVKPEQLRARNGRVRCGHCQAPFNALESLIDDPAAADAIAPAAPEASTPTPPAVPSRPEPVAPAAQQKTEPALPDHFFEAFQTPDQPAAPSHAEPQPGWRTQAPPPRYTIHSPADIAPPMPELDPRHKAPTIGSALDFDLDGDLPEPSEQPSALTRSNWDWQPETDRQEPRESNGADDNMSSEWEQATEVMPTTMVSLEEEEDEVPTPAFFTAYSTPNLKATADTVGETPMEDDAEDTVFEPPEQITAHALEDIESVAPPAAPPDLRREPMLARASVGETPHVEHEAERQFSWEREAEEPRPRAWPWVLGILVLLVLAAGQALLWLRHDIARDFPATRPYFEQACAQLGCVMPWPRVTGQISIEASDLHPRPGHEGSFELAGTLRNRAEFAQAYPYLEITLTDVFNRALVRKVLPPEEWLPASLKNTPAFVPGTDIAFTVYFDALDQPASGYKLYAFYP